MAPGFRMHCPVWPRPETKHGDEGPEAAKFIVCIYCGETASFKMFDQSCQSMQSFTQFFVCHRSIPKCPRTVSQLPPGAGTAVWRLSPSSAWSPTGPTAAPLRLWPGEYNNNIKESDICLIQILVCPLLNHCQINLYILCRFQWP